MYYLRGVVKESLSSAVQVARTLRGFSTVRAIQGQPGELFRVGVGGGGGLLSGGREGGTGHPTVPRWLWSAASAAVGNSGAKVE